MTALLRNGFRTSLGNRSQILAASAGLAVAAGLVTPAAATIVIATSTTAFVDISTTRTSVGAISDDSEFTIVGSALTGAGFAGNELLAGGMSIRVGNNGGVLWGNSAADAFTNATEIGYINASASGGQPLATMVASNTAVN